jgi:hypothetical protein
MVLQCGGLFLLVFGQDKKKLSIPMLLVYKNPLCHREGSINQVQ